jgi:ankyrin repeat protein
MKHPIVLTILLVLSILVTGCGQKTASRNTQTEALFRATRAGNTDMVKALVSSPGADVNAVDESGNTPLLEAARFGHEDICRTLIAAGASLKSKDRDGKTALMLAVQNNHDDVVRELKQAGENE